MSELTRKDKIRSVLQNIKIPSFIFLGAMFICIPLAFFVQPVWPLFSFIGACVLIYGTMVLHYYWGARGHM